MLAVMGLGVRVELACTILLFVIVGSPSMGHAEDSTPVETALALADLPRLQDLSLPETSAPNGGSRLWPAPDICTSRCGCNETEWYVSSRKSRQDWDECGYRGLMVYRRDNGGCLVPSSLAEMQASLDPAIPTSVFVHGSFVEFDWFLKESCATSRWLQSCRCGGDLQTIYFTWPSDENARYMPGSVRELTRRAEFNSFYLAKLLAAVPVDCNAGGKLTVIGHSHGGLMAAAAMHLLGGGAVQGYTSRSRIRWRANVVLAAAAFDRDWLSPRKSSRTLVSLGQTCDQGRYDRAMCVVNRMLLFKNKHDIALKLYPARRLFAKQAIGKTGLSGKEKDRLGGAACRIREIDVTRLLGCKHIWPHYLSQKQIACYVAAYL